MTSRDPNVDPERSAEPTERWGSWEDAEHWRRESFLRRTPAQRMKWLEEMVGLVRRGAALRKGAGK
jgi:hypothetical protein